MISWKKDEVGLSPSFSPHLERLEMCQATQSLTCHVSFLQEHAIAFPKSARQVTSVCTRCTYQAQGIARRVDAISTSKATSRRRPHRTPTSQDHTQHRPAPVRILSDRYDIDRLHDSRTGPELLRTIDTRLAICPRRQHHRLDHWFRVAIGGLYNVRADLMLFLCTILTT